jgi:hypothetical protein
MIVGNENKIGYRKWCENKKNLPLFFRPFWLDLVCGFDNWEVLLSKNNSGEITGVSPFFLTKRWRLSIVQNPPLTPFLGFWINQGANYKKGQDFKFTLDNLTKLITQLPAPYYLTANCHPQLTNPLPLYWKSYSFTTFYTYVISNLQDLEAVEKNFNRNIRRNLRKAQDQLFLEKTVSTQFFYDLHKMTFDRQNIPVPFSKKTFEKLDIGIIKNQVGQKFAAKDAAGNVHAVAYLLWDNERAYYWLAGENPIYRGSGASIFLIWEAIKFTQSELSLSVFDFAGSILKNVEVIRRQFGAAQVPYFHIYKSKNKLVAMLVELLKKRM